MKQYSNMQGAPFASEVEPIYFGCMCEYVTVLSGQRWLSVQGASVNKLYKRRSYAGHLQIMLQGFLDLILD